MPAAVIPAPSEQQDLERLVQNERKAGQGGLRRDSMGARGGPFDREPWRGPAGKGEAYGTACQRLWRERGLSGEGQESGILLPAPTGSES